MHCRRLRWIGSTGGVVASAIKEVDERGPGSRGLTLHISVDSQWRDGVDDGVFFREFVKQLHRAKLRISDVIFQILSQILPREIGIPSAGKRILLDDLIHALKPSLL